MRISGFTIDDFTACAIRVSREKYGRNVIVSKDSGDREYVRVPQCNARLAVVDSHGPGSRTAALAHPRTGNRRHGPWACWHAYRDVLAEVFARYPHAVITAGHAWRVTYRYIDGFNAAYPATGRINVGSAFEPITMPELCGCTADGPALWRVPAVPVHNRSVLAEAERRLRASARLLNDHIDAYVFGPGPGRR